MKTLILQASARPHGDTHRAVLRLAAELAADLLDLLDYSLHHYRYDHAYPPDDQFPELIARCHSYDRLILASPVYWYSMSGHLKVFVDRLTDLLTVQPETGRRLRGKTLGVLGVSDDGDVEACFFKPFELTAGYLGMTYGPEYVADATGTYRLRHSR